jgi:hypothetical protein
MVCVSPRILTHVTSYATSAEAWVAIQGGFASQTQARTVNTWLALGIYHKGNLSVTKYISKMKALGNEMIAAGRQLDDDELIKYIIACLDKEYTPFVSTICARTGPISLSELYYQLLTFETHNGLMQGGQTHSADAAARGGFRGRGHGGGRTPGGHGTAAGHGTFSGRGRGGQGRGAGPSRFNHDGPIICQV